MSLTAIQTYQSPSFRKIGLLVVAAVMIAAVGAGASLEGKNRGSSPAPSYPQVDPSQMMIDRGDLPTQQMVDLSVVFD